MLTGTVKYVNPEKAFGFISRDDREPKVFVHVSQVQLAGVEDLRKGQRYEFDIETDRLGRPAATNLRLI